MKRMLLLCLSLCLILTCLCACFDSENADGENVRINTVDESGNINGYFDFVYEGDTIIGVNQCNKRGKVLLYGSDLKIDDYGNITQIVFRDPDEKLVKTIRWAFPNSISPQAINFNENLFEKYLNQGLIPGYGVETSADGFVKFIGDVGNGNGEGDGDIEYVTSTFIISGGFSSGSFGHVTIPTTFDTFYASPVGYLDITLCEDSIPGTVFNFMIPNDINALEIINNDQYAATISDENDRIIVYHDYASIYSLIVSINHCIYSYDDDGTIKEIKVVNMVEMSDMSTTGMLPVDGTDTDQTVSSDWSYASVIPEYDESGVLISAKAYTKTDRLGAEAAFENGILKESVFYVDNGQKVVSTYLGDGNVHQTIYDADGNITEESDYNENDIHFY